MIELNMPVVRVAYELAEEDPEALHAAIEAALTAPRHLASHTTEVLA